MDGIASAERRSAYLAEDSGHCTTLAWPVVRTLRTAWAGGVFAPAASCIETTAGILQDYYIQTDHPI